MIITLGIDTQIPVELLALAALSHANGFVGTGDRVAQTQFL